MRIAKKVVAVSGIAILVHTVAPILTVVVLNFFFISPFHDGYEAPIGYLRQIAATEQHSLSDRLKMESISSRAIAEWALADVDVAEALVWYEGGAREGGFWLVDELSDKRYWAFPGHIKRVVPSPGYS